MYIFLRYKKEIAEKISVNKWSVLVRMKAALASLGLVILMVIGAGLTFSVQTDSLIINIEDVPYNPDAVLYLWLTTKQRNILKVLFWLFLFPVKVKSLR